MTITTYDPLTGEIRSVRTGASLEDLEGLTEGAPFVEGAWPARFYRVDLETGIVVEK